MLVIYSTAFLLFIILYNLNRIKKVYKLYTIFKNTVDPENKENCCQLFYGICKVVYTLFFPPNLKKFNKNLVKIPYEFRDNKYVYLLKVPRMITPLLYIKDENDKDIMEDIYPYLGPNLDCHQADIYPKDFGLKRVCVKDINDKEYVFEENDMIKLE